MVLDRNDYNSSAMSNERNRDDDNDGNVLSPASVPYSNKRRGWDGNHMELQREQPTAENLASHVAVNLEQFRNEKIGVGYQAKHVIRQRSVPDTSVVINNMTKDATSNIQVLAKRKHEKINNADREPKPIARLQKYLKCENLRKFRKELASMESSS